MAIVRQGDVTLIRRHEDTEFPIPQRWRVQANEDGRLVLAHGESTGHYHSVEESPAVELYRNVGQNEGQIPFLLRVRETVKLDNHPDHPDLEIPPGVYDVIMEREYDPETVSRRVYD